MLDTETSEARFLLKAIEDGEAVLVLGAGASANCTRPNGDRVLMGRALARLLADKAALPYANEDLPEVIAATIDRVISTSRFHQILQEQYKRVTPSSELSDLLQFTWRRLYTWNIDDSIENVGFSVQRRRYFNGMIDKVASHEGLDYLQVIHLHGEALKTEHGFIFSTQDYNKRLNHDDHDWYRALADDYISFTPIFVGSRLQEPILSAELDRARPTPGSGLGRAYLVSPDDFTEMQMAGFIARDIVVVKATLEDFVHWLQAKIRHTVTPADVARRSNEFADRLLNAGPVNPADVEAAKYIVLHSWRATKTNVDAFNPSSLARLARTFLEGGAPTWRLEAISESMRNVCGEGLDGRAKCDSGQVFEALPETSCGPRPPAGSIAARAYAMEVT